MTHPLPDTMDKNGTISKKEERQKERKKVVKFQETRKKSKHPGIGKEKTTYKGSGNNGFI